MRVTLPPAPHSVDLPVGLIRHRTFFTAIPPTPPNVVPGEHYLFLRSGNLIMWFGDNLPYPLESVLIETADKRIFRNIRYVDVDITVRDNERTAV